MSNEQNSRNQNIPDISKLGINEAGHESLLPAARKKTSLLSSSIAAQQQQQQEQQQKPQPIAIAIRPQQNSEEDVPEEPSLFATSVGDNYSGRLVPSSSTISLFSLNSDNTISDELKLPQHQLNYSTAPFERKNSLSSISSSQQMRFNNTSHKQRHQHYMAALTPISSNPSTPNLRKMEDKSTSPQQIPHPNGNYPPEPYIEPTSLGGSPSMFYLTSKTPPASLNNMSYFPNHLKFQQQQQQQQAQGTKIQTQLSDRSPDLMPIGTPNDMPPMTPLLLNNNAEDFRFTSASAQDSRDWE